MIASATALSRRRAGGALLAALMALSACRGPAVQAPPTPAPLPALPYTPPTPVSPAVAIGTTATRSPDATRIPPSPTVPMATAISTATTVPMAAGDPRFAVVLDATKPEAVANAVRRLHATWFDGPATGALEGAPTQLQHPSAANLDQQDLAALAERARRLPGRAWSMGIEPNGFSASDPRFQPDAYAVLLHHIASTIKAADPTAILVGPDVLDWSTGCIGCSGMVTGEAWSKALRAAYIARYQLELPFDVWSIHTYPLDWLHLPTVNDPLMEQQIIDCRAYLDSVPALRNTPIWITELGAHWGYTAYQFAPQQGRNVLVPAGALRSDLVAGYFRRLLQWLIQNGRTYQVARWFVWAADNPDVPGDHAGAISLLDGPGPAAQLTDYGRIFVALQEQ